MLLPSLPLDELRRRVREAESLLRVAKSHARDRRGTPDEVAYSTQRITTLLGEVDGLFPGLRDPQVPDENIERLVGELTAAAETAGGQVAPAPAEDVEETDEGDLDESGDPAVENGDDEKHEGEDDGEEGEGEEEGDDDDDCDIDYSKLAVAIENEQLMSAMPEPARSTFRTVARYLIETHERQQLMQRISAGIGELSDLTQRNMEEAQRKAALAMTFEELANRRKV